MRKLFVLVGMATVAVLAMSSPAAAKSTTCSGTQTGQAFSGDLVVPANGSCTIVSSTVGDDVKVGENAYFEADNSQIADDVKGRSALTVFLHNGTTVGGNVKTKDTFKVFVFDSTIDGHIAVSRTTGKTDICGNTVDGRVQVRGGGGDILIGDPLANGCAGNTVLDHHRIRVEDNSVDVELVIRGNHIQGGDLEVNDNSGPADKFVENNAGGHSLECRGNEQPFTASGNTGWNRKEGQCAEPPRECTSTISGETIPGDLVVPDNEACTISNATVGGDVKVGKNAFFQADSSQIGDDVQAKGADTVFLNTGTTVADDVKTSDTARVFLFNGTVGGGVRLWRTSARVNICGETVSDDVAVKNGSGDVLVGDLQTVGCPGNTFNGGEVEIQHNFVDVELVVRDNNVPNGDLEVNDNSGPVDKFVQNNTGGNALECRGNDPAFTGTPNAFAKEEGQCAEI